MSDCQCPARFSGNDEEEYRAHGCPNCVCRGPNIVLNEKDWNALIENLENPPPPSEALIRARQRFLDLRKKDIQDKMDETMVAISAPKRL
jgi:hypothetical protein